MGVCLDGGGGMSDQDVLLARHRLDVLRELERRCAGGVGFGQRRLRLKRAMWFGLVVWLWPG